MYVYVYICKVNDRICPSLSFQTFRYESASVLIIVSNETLEAITYITHIYIYIYIHIYIQIYIFSTRIATRSKDILLSL